MSKLNVILIFSIIIVLYSLDVAGDINTTTGRLRKLFSKLDTDYGTNNRVMNSFETCMKTDLSHWHSSSADVARLYYCISVAVTSFLGKPNPTVENSSDFNSAVKNLKELFKKLDNNNSANNMNTCGIFSHNMEYQLGQGESHFARLSRSISAAITEFGA